jgi:hypothetical protein
MSRHAMPKSKQPARTFDAGASAGHRWVAAARNKPGLARLRKRIREHHPGFDNRDPVAAYATLLTNRFFVCTIDGEDQFSVTVHSIATAGGCFLEFPPRLAATRDGPTVILCRRFPPCGKRLSFRMGDKNLGPDATAE